MGSLWVIVVNFVLLFKIELSLNVFFNGSSASKVFIFLSFEISIFCFARRVSYTIKDFYVKHLALDTQTNFYITVIFWNLQRKEFT